MHIIYIYVCIYRYIYIQYRYRLNLSSEMLVTCVTQKIVMEIEAFLSLLRDDYIQVEGTYITYNMIIKVLRAPAMFNALKEKHCVSLLQHLT